MSRHVAVLMGGRSAEREVSLTSGAACADALARRGYRVSRIDVGPDLAERLAACRPDSCFNALHGRFGEDGCVQGLLEIMGIPYTHSGVRASAVAMHKPTAKEIFAQHGLSAPEGKLATLDAIATGNVMAPPFVVKPAAEGSSVGVLVIEDLDDPRLRPNAEAQAGEALLVERFVAGAELTCAVLDGQPLTVTEIRPREGFYDYRAKYTAGIADHLVPAPLPEAVFQTVMDWSARAHAILGCRGVSRADFRFDPARGEAGLFILEVNTQPGMTPLSLVPEQAAHVGIGFDELVVRLVEDASCDR
ncbi:MAG: D-alanine--D-alanine ligase [Geminicoccaceae bacterium]|nr:MAG: D-alanine--D-alanine ligase [Geminicoccaceae bacterium]